jgi:hypothetical protein
LEQIVACISRCEKERGSNGGEERRKKREEVRRRA